MRFKQTDKRHSFRILWTVAFLLLAAVSLCAQIPTATLLGSVRDTSGGLMSGATITAENLETHLSRTAKTSLDGTYRFSALPVGPYNVSIEAQGFAPQIRQGIRLAVGQEAVVNFVLSVGGIAEQITVTGEASQVNVTSGSLGGVVDENAIQDLPLNGRNYVDLSLMQLGITEHKNVRDTAGGGGLWYSANGAPPRSNNYLLDGASMVTLRGATAASIAKTALGVEGIREYKVVTNSFSAEYGMSMGSQMTIVTKSGSNQFHGSAFEYFRNSALDARNFFDYPRYPGDSRRLPQFQRNQFGASLGGPILRDKTFFFGVYEGLRENLGVTTVNDSFPATCFDPSTQEPLMTNNPCATLSSGNVASIMQPFWELYPYPNLPSLTPGAPPDRYTFHSTKPTTEDYGQIRIDHTFSGSDSLFGRYTIDDAIQHPPSAWPQYVDIYKSRAQYFSLAETHVFSSALVNNWRATYSRTRFFNDSISSKSDGGQLIGDEYSFLPGKQMGSLSITGVTTLGPGAASPSDMVQNIYSLGDDVFLAKGRHSLKFGFLFNYYEQGVFQEFQQRGTLTFRSSPIAYAQFLAGLQYQYSSATPGSDQSKWMRYKTFGFYLQDDFRASDRLTLNLGLRYEFMTTAREVLGRASNLRDPLNDAEPTVGEPMFLNPSLRNFSPRVGFAWDMFGDGKMALRGGFALTYDIGNVGSALIQAGIGTPPFASLSSVTAQSQQPSDLIPVSLPLTYTDTNRGKVIRLIDYRMHNPHMAQWNFTAERQLPGDMVLSLAYSGSRGINLFQVGDTNPRIPTMVNDVPTWTNSSPRINPNYESIYYIHTGGDSWYNGFQVGFSKRMSRGLQFMSNYTFSRNFDTTQGQFPADNAGYPPYNIYPFDNRYERGPTAFDVTHNWRFYLIYRLPRLYQGSNGFVNQLVNGWWTSPLISYQTGYPFSPLINGNTSHSGIMNSGSNDRPNVLAGRTPDNIILGTPAQWFDPTAFSIPEPPAGSPAGSGTLGNVARGFLRGPSSFQFDLSIVKDFQIEALGEEGKVEFRSEFFNILNRPNFSMPDVTINTGRSGTITSTSSTSRQIQFALRIAF